MNRTSVQAALGAIVLALGCTLALAQTPQGHDHAFHGAEAWARYFDDPAREAWQKPDEVMRALAPAPDAVLADIGAGTGYFAVRLARAAPRGRVYAVDVSPDMVRYLAERAAREKLPNLLAVTGGADDPRLPEKVDRVLLVNAYHHIGGREDYFRRLAAYLKPGAEVAIIDFAPGSPVGPPAHARIPAGQVVAEMERAGYRLARRHDFLPHQFFLVFRAD